VLLTACARATAAIDASGAIDACLARLDEASDVGYQRVTARCPDLAPALAASPWAARLPADWRQNGNELSAAGLRELRTLLQRQQQSSPAAAHIPDPAHIAPLLARLLPAQEQSEGPWMRFKRWLRHLLAPHSPPADSGWLSRLFRGDNVPEM